MKIVNATHVGIPHITKKLYVELTSDEAEALKAAFNNLNRDHIDCPALSANQEKFVIELIDRFAAAALAD